MHIKLPALLGICMLLSWFLLAEEPLFAQQPLTWSEPQPLNMWDSENGISFPDLVADAFGRLHVVTVRNYSEDNNGFIYYSRLDDQGWSTPVDILAAPNSRSSSIERFGVDKDGALFLLWSELNTGLFWSYSVALDATSARAWETNLLIPDATRGDFVMEGDEISLIYVDRDRDIFFRRSMDAGATWTPDVTVWSPPSNTQATFTLRLAKDKEGILHIAWTETDEVLNWNPSAVWYARSLDGGQTWRDFLRIPDQGSYINIGFDALNNVHLLWNHNVGSVDGRYHAISKNGGETWSEPQWIFPGLSGRTGFPQLVLDSAGSLHQFTSGRGMGLEGGIYHSLWSGDQWASPILISKPVSEDNNEGPVAAITSGNLIHVIWRNNVQIHDVLYAYTWVDAPERENASLFERVNSLNTPSPEPTRAVSLVVPESSTLTWQSSEHPSGASASISLVFIPILSVVLVIVIAAAWNARKSQR